MTSSRRWRTGELAEAVDATVRTIHHYEHVGLLAPRERPTVDSELGEVLRVYRA